MVDELAGRKGIRITREECRSLIGRAEIGSVMAELVKPQTYMNLSGEAVGCLLSKPEREIEKLIVVSDDLALPFGTIRIRARGSHGGQNGLRSIIDHLKTQEFIRLRMGIGPEHPLTNAKKYVLENFSRTESESLGAILKNGADAVETIVNDGVDAAMASFN